MTSEDLIALFPILAVFILHIAAIGQVAAEKGYHMLGMMVLAFFAPPVAWLYLIAMPITVKRAAERQMNVADWVAEIERKEAGIAARSAS